MIVRWTPAKCKWQPFEEQQCDFVHVIELATYLGPLPEEMSRTSSSKYAPVKDPVQAKRKVSQSLFLVDYLGKKPVSESCSDVTIPWVIEELRLKKRGDSPYWFTPGLEHFALVSESGEQQLECPHGDIVRCCLGGGDGCSFAVVVRLGVTRRRKAGENVQCICHAFEAANAQDVSVFNTVGGPCCAGNCVFRHCTLATA